MKPLATFAMVACLMLGVSGCNIFDLRKRSREINPPTPENENTGTPTAEALVNYLQKQSDALSSVDTRDLGIQVRYQGSSNSLDGRLSFQKPRSMKLVGRKFGDQVIAGSNNERFWFWVKQDPSDALYHCSYTDFDRGVDMPIPFQPEWILDAFGMSAPGPASSYKFEEDRLYYRLTESGTLRGQPIRKEILFYKGQARGDQPQIVSRTIYDSNNRVLFNAKIKNVYRFDSRWSVPTVISLEWPQHEMKMDFDLGDRPNINNPSRVEDFTMPRLGSRQIDLGRDHPTSRGVVPASR